MWVSKVPKIRLVFRWQWNKAKGREWCTHCEEYGNPRVHEGWDETGSEFSKSETANRNDLTLNTKNLQRKIWIQSRKYHKVLFFLALNCQSHHLAVLSITMKNDEDPNYTMDQGKEQKADYWLHYIPWYLTILTRQHIHVECVTFSNKITKLDFFALTRSLHTNVWLVKDTCSSSS